MTSDELKAAAERLRNPSPADAYPWPCEMHEQPLQRSLDAHALARAHLANHGRLLALVESYLAMGTASERIGLSRRAAAYRSVANMLGAVLQGSEPVPVDFLVRYPEADS